MFSFLITLILLNIVGSQSCGVEDGTTVTSAAFPEYNGCYEFIGNYNGFPGFGQTNGDGYILPGLRPLEYSPDVWRWSWGSAGGLMCWTDGYPFGSPGSDVEVVDSSCRFNGVSVDFDIGVQFSCGCSSLPEEEEEEEDQCEQITLSGGDASLGDSGGISGFPLIDGCYTKKYINYFINPAVTGNNDKKLFLNYVKYDSSYSDEWETRGPRFVKYDDFGTDHWHLSQFPGHGDDDDVDEIVYSQGVMYSFETPVDPTGATSWYSVSDRDRVNGISITCGCSSDENVSESEDDDLTYWDRVESGHYDDDYSDVSESEDDDLTYWDRVESGHYDSDVSDDDVPVSESEDDDVGDRNSETSGSSSSGTPSGIIAGSVIGSIGIIGIIVVIVNRIRVKISRKKRMAGNQLSKRSSRTTSVEIDVEVV